MAGSPDRPAAEGATQAAGPRAVSTADVLLAEYARIWGEAGAPADETGYRRKVNKSGQAALCFSGGGIRSAAFALGLLQALSRARLLTGFHYLSTVSGGGYMAGWLQRWIHEAKGGAGEVMTRLGGDKQPDEVRHLRENSNFLTPRVGLGSNDTWTAIAISVRNILVNWLLFAPLIMLVALLPNFFHDSVRSIRPAAKQDTWFLVIPLVLASLAIARATFATVRLMPSYRAASTGALGEGDRLLNRRIVWPLVAWSVFATLAIAIELLGEGDAQKVVLLHALLWGHGTDVAFFSLGGMVTGLVVGAATLGSRERRTLVSDLVVWPVSFLVSTAWIALGSVMFSSLVSAKLDRDWGPVILTIAAPLWMLCATLMGAIVFVAFRKSAGPQCLPDDDREWISRLSAVKIKPMLFWMVLSPSVLLLSALAASKTGGGELSLSSIVAVVAGLVAVGGGRSHRTGAAVKSAGRSAMKYLPLNAIVAIATFLFIVALLVVFGLLEYQLATKVEEWILGLAGPLPQGLNGRVTAHFLIFIALVALLYDFGRRIPVNRFSLNGFYRNRLARAFLGAARAVRAPDPFTGFDSADNVRLHTVAPAVDGKTVLYPVLNVALNVTATENLAWQERKAEPFVFTPLYSGSGMLAREGSDPPVRDGAYVASVNYAGGERDMAMGASTGVTLATAMSLSGAAATPNMGYYSAPATAFLMTLFNVRLGAWLPNPGRAETLKDEIGRSSPSNSIGALFREMAGSTHDRGLDVYLSDGGHFENLGLYEMIRRRCRFMVVSDAGSDPECSFKDLGNAVRKVKIDLDVDIHFNELHIASRDEPLEDQDLQLAWALGEVRYPDKDGRGKQLEGRIVYIKPSYFGEGMPVDVIAYARGSKSFPHESTADQFFSESQFESYRHLADHYLSKLLGEAKADEDGASIATLFAALDKRDVHAGRAAARKSRK